MNLNRSGPVTIFKHIHFDIGWSWPNQFLCLIHCRYIYKKILEQSLIRKRKRTYKQENWSLDFTLWCIFYFESFPVLNFFWLELGELTAKFNLSLSVMRGSRFGEYIAWFLNGGTALRVKSFKILTGTVYSAKFVFCNN